ncbi:MAG: 30S ribosome-binding factor RbfA [Dehalococcoidales bacterium]|nr:30S ribosome-binding factor RbfA [Dehalococcoidales bacterium]
MSHRIERVNHLIRAEISELIQREVKDPRLNSLVSITDVETSQDMKHARVFVSCICSEEERQNILKALTAAAGFLHRELTKSLRMRIIPDLSFHWDDSMERADHITQLLDRVNSERQE